MFDVWMIFFFFLHMSTLLGLTLYGLHRMGIAWRESAIIGLLLFWTGLVFASNGASVLGALGNLAFYVPLSFLGVGLALALFLSVKKIPATLPLIKPPALALTSFSNQQLQQKLFWFLLGSMGLFALINLALGMLVIPDNADSMIYRLPRSVWYASTGSFLHPFGGIDNRLLYYPLDGVMLYIPVVLYGLPGTFHAIPSLVSWICIAYVAYRFARSLGADRFYALFASWLLVMTPSVLAQSISTNDEIIAAGAFLCGLFMGWRWLVSGRHFYFFMMGVALALSAGTKLHIIFLLPLIGVVFLAALLQARKNPALVKRWAQSIGGKTAFQTLLVMAVLFLPFLFYNYASTGRFYFFNDFKSEVFNESFSARVVFQNLVIYLSQMFFAPIADLNFWPNANARQGFNTALNSIFDPLIRPLLDSDPKHYHLEYRFVGITIPVSVRFVEFSLWSAFIWLLWPFQARLALKYTHPIRIVFFLLALTPPLWLVIWSFSTLYMEGTATYFTFYLICAAPAAVMVFGEIRRPLWNDLRWVCITLVVLTNLIICHNLVMYSGFRAIPDLFYAKHLPYDWLLTEDRIIKEIRGADRLRILATHPKMPYFGYMHWNPAAKFLTPYDIKVDKIPNFQDVLQIYPISSLNFLGYMPLRIPDKKTVGLTYLGAVRAIGREAIFATGHGVEKRYPDESNYIVLKADTKQEPQTGKWIVSINPVAFGLFEQDRLLFEYIVSLNNKAVYHYEKSSSPGVNFFFDQRPYDLPASLTIIVSSAWSGKELTRATYNLHGRGSWLPDGNEY